MGKKNVLQKGRNFGRFSIGVMRALIPLSQQPEERREPMLPILSEHSRWVLALSGLLLTWLQSELLLHTASRQGLPPLVETNTSAVPLLKGHLKTWRSLHFTLLQCQFCYCENICQLCHALEVDKGVLQVGKRPL